MTGKPPDPPQLGTDELAYWRALALQERQKELPALRDLAGRWFASLSTVAGVLGVVGLSVSPGALTRRTQAVQDAGLLLLAALAVSAVLSVLWAVRAAQGGPRVVSDAPEVFRQAWNEAVQDLRRTLHRSRVAAGTALGLLLVYSALLTVTHDAPPRFVRLLSRGQVLCGQLRFGPDGVGALLTQDGQLRHPDISTLEPVEQCQ